MKKSTFIFTFLFIIIFIPKDTFALSSSDYANRHKCANFELAGAHTDGSADYVACYNSFSEAHNAMVSNGANDLIVFDERGTTKIVDAQYALADLMEPVVNFYEYPSLNTRKYMAVSGLITFNSADGAYISTNESNYAGKVMFQGFTGYISKDVYEIVPINWLKSKSYYKVTNDTIYHYHTSSIQMSSSTSSLALGPKPDMLSEGTYYSYDGHYFYRSLIDMLKDYKNNTHNSSVNKNNPYYNYYMYLSNHSKTNYSSQNINEYVKKMGYTKQAYSNIAQGKGSRLYGQGVYFYNSQQVYGINALLSFSLSRNETGNGRSTLSINKNNGFGLNAVDSNVYEGADYFPTFASSIYEYASRWNSYGFSYATDYRYFGPAFGDKLNGMNVKYATDALWSEKMASNYYQFDKVMGLNDYNFYQLGIVTKPTNAYLYANNSKTIYTYPEYGDQLLIVGESGNYYKVMSDMNIDSNGNLIGSHDDYTKPYNWNSYVYVLKSDVNLINKAKYGYKSPNDVTNYLDSKYTYDLYVEGATLKPKVAKLVSDANYYEDSTLQTATGKKVLKDKLVMVYSTAYNEQKVPVSYLITSDYFYDQKSWVSADKIKFVSSSYGKQTVTTNGQYEEVCSTPVEVKNCTVISGLYSNSYTPIISDEGTRYKVPVSLDSNNNSYGYVLKSEPVAYITKYEYKVSNNEPVINASNKTIKQGDSINLLENVSATDVEDGNITSNIQVNGTVDKNKVGNYNITYKVTDNGGLTTTKNIVVSIISNEKPVINAGDKEITVNTEFNKLDGVTAQDKESGNLTNKIEVITNTVDTKKIGVYKVVYQVSDGFNVVTKEIKVTVSKDNEPVITVKDIEIGQNSKFDPMSYVKVEDKEDGNITNKVKVVTNTVDIKTLGVYKVIYQVTDSAGNKVEKEIKVQVVEKVLEEKDGNFFFKYLKQSDNGILLQGYQTIFGIDNNLKTDISYKIELENIETGKITTLRAERIVKESDIPKKVYSPDGRDYTYSWFNASIDVDKLELGNYKMYVIAESSDYYSRSIISNKVYNYQETSVKGTKNNVTISNNYDTRESFVELKIRNEVVVNKTSSYIYNQYEKFTNFEFDNDKLHLSGNSYSYGMDMSSNSKVERKIVFENKDNYKTYVRNLDSINKNKRVFLPVEDNLDKSKAWYDNSIDISDIPKGEYIIYIVTEANISDISEMKEKLSRNLDSVVATINNKKYSFSINKDRGNRIEMSVK